MADAPANNADEMRRIIANLTRANGNRARAQLRHRLSDKVILQVHKMILEFNVGVATRASNIRITNNGLAVVARRVYRKARTFCRLRPTLKNRALSQFVDEIAEVHQLEQHQIDHITA